MRITRTLLLLLFWNQQSSGPERKLGFLMRVMASDMDSLSRSVLLAMCDDVESVYLVRECVGIGTLW